MHYTYDLNSIRNWTIEHQHFFEARNLKDSQGGQIGVFERRMPAYLRLCGQKAKGLMGSQEEAVTEVGACLSCEVICLVVEVFVGLGADDVDSTHRAPVFLRRSSSRTCFSCQ